MHLLCVLVYVTTGGSLSHSIVLLLVWPDVFKYDVIVIVVYFSCEWCAVYCFEQEKRTCSMGKLLCGYFIDSLITSLSFIIVDDSQILDPLKSQWYLDLHVS